MNANGFIIYHRIRRKIYFHPRSVKSYMYRLRCSSVGIVLFLHSIRTKVRPPTSLPTIELPLHNLDNIFIFS
jgi:hypothetical protein